MHFIPDTEDEDSANEVFWPEGYKQVLREDVPGAIARQLAAKGRYRRLYRQVYAARYADYEQFLARIAEMVAIGAENGADDAFDEITDAFLEEDALPDPRRYTGYLWPVALADDTRDRVRQIVVNEYGEDDIFRFAYDVGYKNDFGSYREYLERVGNVVVAGARNGANDALDGIYRSFMDGDDRLLTLRRYPRRLKMLLQAQAS